jgi:hypothetical protein
MDRCVGSITEGLVLRRAAAAQGYAVSHFIFETIRSDDLNPAS